MMNRNDPLDSCFSDPLQWPPLSSQSPGRFSGGMRIFVGFLIVAFLGLACGACGSGDASRGKKGGSAVTKKKKKKKRPVKKEFANAGEAIRTFKTAITEKHNEQMLVVQGWIVQHASETLAPLTALAKDSTASTSVRVSACRVLGYMGKQGTASLLEIMTKRGMPIQVRRQAAKSVSQLRPIEKRTMEGMIALLNESDSKLLITALGTLKQLGPLAQEAAPRIEEIIQTSRNKYVRVAAGEARRTVSPRRTLIPGS